MRRRGSNNNGLGLNRLGGRTRLAGLRNSGLRDSRLGLDGLGRSSRLAGLRDSGLSGLLRRSGLSGLDDGSPLGVAGGGGRVNSGGSLADGAVSDLSRALGDDVGVSSVQGGGQVASGRRDNNVSGDGNLSHRADSGRDSNGLSGDMRLGRAVGDLRRAVGDSVNAGGVDG